MDLSTELLNEAVSLGLCKQWQEEWEKNSTPQQLIDKYLRGIDFCLARHWPTCDFITAHFDRALLRKNNILVNDKYSLLNPDIAVLLGNTVSTIRLNGNRPSRIYLCDQTNAKIYLKTREMVVIEVRDTVQLEVICDDYYRQDVKVFDYSSDAVIIAPKGVPCLKQKDYLLQ